MIQKTCNDSRTEHKSIFWQIYAAKVWAVLHADLSHCSSATIQFDASNLAKWVKLISTCRFLKTSSLQYCTFSKLFTRASGKCTFLSNWKIHMGHSIFPLFWSKALQKTKNFEILCIFSPCLSLPKSQYITW